MGFEMAKMILECGCEVEHSGHSHNAIVRTVRKCFGESAKSCVNPHRDEDHTSLKRDLAEVLKKHGAVNEKTVGKIALTVNCGGVRDIEWLNLRIA